MKRFRFIVVLMLASLLTFGLAACGGGSTGGGSQEQEAPLTGDSNVLVAYFSWSSSHNTQTIRVGIASTILCLHQNTGEKYFSPRKDWRYEKYFANSDNGKE